MLTTANKSYTNEFSKRRRYALISTPASGRIQKCHTSLFAPSKPVLVPVDRKQAWDDLDLTYCSLETLPDPLKLASLDRIISEEMDLMHDPKPASDVDTYHRRCRINSMAWTAFNLKDTRDRGTFRRPYPEVSRDAKQFQEPVAFTARDVIALDLLHRRVHKDNSASTQQQFESLGSEERCRRSRDLRMTRALELKREKANAYSNGSITDFDS